MPADKELGVQVADLTAEKEFGVQVVVVSEVAVVKESSKVPPATEVKVAEIVEAVAKPIKDIVP